MHLSRTSLVSVLFGIVGATQHDSTASAASLTVTASETSLATGAAFAASATAIASAGDVITHVVQVGGPNGSLVFQPNNVKANVGDLVQFQFYPKNHSVVQSTFDKPCIPIQNVMSNMTMAFFSGFMPSNTTMGTTNNLLTYTVRVMDTKPMWYYCGQGKHCQGGMVGAINAATSGNKTVDAFKEIAKSVPESIVPGTGADAGGNASPSGGTATQSSGAGGSGESATGASTGAPARQTTGAATGMYESASRQSLLGLIAGCVVAVVLL